MLRVPVLQRAQTSSPTTAIEVARAALATLFGPAEGRTFAARLWDGSVERPLRASPTFTLALRRPGALRRMLLPPSELALAEAYLRDDFDVEGNLESAFDLIARLAERLRSPAWLARLVTLLRTLPTDDLAGTTSASGGSKRGWPALHRPRRRHSRHRDAAAVRHHYDVGNDFYALWLDRRMVYSCAYFTQDTDDLDTAQAAKLDLICRKLRLEPGERLLDIGCGWGGLIQYAAERYDVRATGITLSEPQAALARQRIAAAGLGDRCHVAVCDYRDVPRATVFDKVVSVGMVEHVGAAKLPRYFTEAYRLTRPGGLFLNHGIVSAPAGSADLVNPLLGRLWRHGSFIQRYVFPDGELEPLDTIIGDGESAGFETRDVENLREHYALTLRHWVHRLESRHAEVVALTDEQSYRIWRLYMSGSAQGFASGRLGVVQTLFSRPDENGHARLPLRTRGPARGKRADSHRSSVQATTIEEYHGSIPWVAPPNGPAA